MLTPGSAPYNPVRVTVVKLLYIPGYIHSSEHSQGVYKQRQATQDTWSNKTVVVQFSVRASKQHLLDFKDTSLCLLVAKEGNVVLSLIFSDRISHNAHAHTCLVILVLGNTRKNLKVQWESVRQRRVRLQDNHIYFLLVIITCITCALAILTILGQDILVYCRCWEVWTKEMGCVPEDFFQISLHNANKFPLMTGKPLGSMVQKLCLAGFFKISIPRSTPITGLTSSQKLGLYFAQGALYM